MDAERAAFEEFCTSQVRRDEGERFMALARNGEYVSPAARAAWAAWQARGLWDADQLKAEGDRLMWRTYGQPATLLRVIQTDAAHGLELVEGVPGKDDATTRVGQVAMLFACIHQRIALAMHLKPTAPGGNDGR